MEINKVLKTGGLVFIHSHQTFPLHDYPGDFLRFSEEGFKELFSENLGFEILTTDSQVPCRVVPSVEIPGWLNDHQATSILPSVRGKSPTLIRAHTVGENLE